MTDAECFRRELVERVAESFVAQRPGVPGLGGLWVVVAERQDEPAELLVLGSDALFASAASACVMRSFLAALQWPPHPIQGGSGLRRPTPT